jgi:hypothetical protein
VLYNVTSVCYITRDTGICDIRHPPCYITCYITWPNLPDAVGRWLGRDPPVARTVTRTWTRRRVTVMVRQLPRVGNHWSWVWSESWACQRKPASEIEVFFTIGRLIIIRVRGLITSRPANYPLSPYELLLRLHLGQGRPLWLAMARCWCLATYVGPEEIWRYVLRLSEWLRYLDSVRYGGMSSPSEWGMSSGSLSHQGYWPGPVAQCLCLVTSTCLWHRYLKPQTVILPVQNQRIKFRTTNFLPLIKDIPPK